MTRKQVLVSFALVKIVVFLAMAYWVFEAYQSSGGWILLVVALGCIGGAVVGFALWLWARNLGREEVDQSWPPI